MRGCEEGMGGKWTDGADCFEIGGIHPLLLFECVEMSERV